VFGHDGEAQGCGHLFGIVDSKRAPISERPCGDEYRTYILTISDWRQLCKYRNVTGLCFEANQPLLSASTEEALPFLLPQRGGVLVNEHGGHAAMGAMMVLCAPDHV